MFERSWVRNPAPYTGWTFGHFFALICCHNCIVCLKKPKINEKEAGVGPFLKKTNQKWLNYPKCLRNFEKFATSFEIPNLILDNPFEQHTPAYCYLPPSLTHSLPHSCRVSLEDIFSKSVGNLYLPPILILPTYYLHWSRTVLQMFVFIYKCQSCKLLLQGQWLAERLLPTEVDMGSNLVICYVYTNTLYLLPTLEQNSFANIFISFTNVKAVSCF